MYENIEAERARYKMTVEHLCNRLKISRSTYYSWFKHGNIPSSKLVEMSCLFKCTTDYLLGLSENKTA